MSGPEDESGDRDVVEVPYRELSAEALRGLAESFVLREGTDYGERTYELEHKVEHVLDQLARGDAVIVFSPVSGSADIILRRELRDPKLPRGDGENGSQGSSE